jgi:putative Mg2+ transporter-C (MgtC) family protein
LVGRGIGVGGRRRSLFRPVVATGIILVILAGLKPIEDAYRARNQSYLVTVRLEPRSLDLDGMKKALGVRGGQIKRVVTGIGKDGLEEQRIHLTRVSRSDVHKGAERLKAEPGVQAVETTRRGTPAVSDDR